MRPTPSLPYPQTTNPSGHDFGSSFVRSRRFAGVTASELAPEELAKLLGKCLRRRVFVDGRSPFIEQPADRLRADHRDPIRRDSHTLVRENLVGCVDATR